MSMYRVISCVAVRKCMLWPVHSHGRMILVRFQGKPFNITVIHIYAPTSNAEIQWFSENLQDLLEHQKKMSFTIGDWNAKVGSQDIPGVTRNFGLGVQNEAGQRLTEFCWQNALVIANTLFQQHKRQLYRWTSPDGQYWNQIDYILCSQRWRSSIQSAKTRLGADCGSDYKLLIAKFKLKLKKVGETTKPVRYDLNQIPYDYTVEVRNRFKGLDLIDRVPEKLWMEVQTSYRRQYSRSSLRKRTAKMQNLCLRRPYKYLRKEEKLKAKEKRKDIPIWMQSSKEYQGEIRKPSSVINAKK